MTRVNIELEHMTVVILSNLLRDDRTAAIFNQYYGARAYRDLRNAVDDAMQSEAFKGKD